jgi:hypothetical protein
MDPGTIFTESRLIEVHSRHRFTEINLGLQVSTLRTGSALLERYSTDT